MRLVRYTLVCLSGLLFAAVTPVAAGQQTTPPPAATTPQAEPTGPVRVEADGARGAHGHVVLVPLAVERGTERTRTRPAPTIPLGDPDVGVLAGAVGPLVGLEVERASVGRDRADEGDAREPGERRARDEGAIRAAPREEDLLERINQLVTA